jgi:hypothetical protein
MTSVGTTRKSVTMNNEPESLIDSLHTAAIAMHEMYISLRDAGFTKDEALRIVYWVATGGPRPI